MLWPFSILCIFLNLCTISTIPQTLTRCVIWVICKLKQNFLIWKAHNKTDIIKLFILSRCVSECQENLDNTALLSGCKPCQTHFYIKTMRVENASVHIWTNKTTSETCCHIAWSCPPAPSWSWPWTRTPSGLTLWTTWQSTRSSWGSSTIIWRSTPPGWCLKDTKIYS